MAKITEQDVIRFLRDRVAQISRDLDFVQNAIKVIEGTSSQDSAPKRGRKQVTGNEAPLIASKTAGAKRGRKPKAREIQSERIMAADQLG